MNKDVRILVVDDEMIVREALSNYLREDGYEAIAVESGEEALKKVESERWNILFVDFKMPGMDGLEVLREVKKVTSDLPVIIITAYATVDSAVQAMKDGAYDYVVKPFSIDVLFKRIEAILRRRNPPLQRIVKIGDWKFDFEKIKSSAYHDYFYEPFNTKYTIDAVENSYYRITAKNIKFAYMNDFDTIAFLSLAICFPNVLMLK